MERQINIKLKKLSININIIYMIITYFLYNPVYYDMYIGILSKWFFIRVQKIDPECWTK